MKNTYKIKQIIIIILIIIIIGAIYLSIKSKETIVPVDNTIVNTELEEIKTYNLCYYRSNKTDRGFYDTAWLKLNIKGENITGEFQNLPAEKDSKIGTFEGTVGPVNQKNMARSANVWWNSFAEGMNNKEELIIELEHFKSGDFRDLEGMAKWWKRGFSIPYRKIYHSGFNLFFKTSKFNDIIFNFLVIIIYLLKRNMVNINQFQYL
jgi:hypothetical protein